MLDLRYQFLPFLHDINPFHYTISKTCGGWDEWIAWFKMANFSFKLETLYRENILVRDHIFFQPCKHGSHKPKRLGDRR
jgi:hypothetical protein